MNMSILPKELVDIIMDYKYQFELKIKKNKIHNELISKVKLRNIKYVRYTYYEYYNNETNETKTNEILEGTNVNDFYLDDSSDLLFIYENEDVKCVIENHPNKTYIQNIN